MKILVVTQELPSFGSGIANVVDAIRRQLSLKHVSVEILSQKGADINISGDFGVSTLPGAFGLIPFWQKTTRYILKNKDKYDLIWLHQPLLMKANKLFRLNNLVYTFHTTYYGYYKAFKAHAISKLLLYYKFLTKFESEMFKRISENNASLVTFVSQSVAEEASANGLNASPTIIPNGLYNKSPIDLSKTAARELIRHKFSIDIAFDERLLFYFGRITEQKQLFLLVECFRFLTILDPNTHLIIAGKGNLLDRLKKKVAKQSNIYVLGYISQENLDILVKASDAFISLSCYEGLPLATLESMSLGIPTILSDIPAHKWLMSFSFSQGILVDQYNPDPQAISCFIKGLQNKNNKLELKQFVNEFTWERVSEKYLKLFRNHESRL